MDPNENLREQRELASLIIESPPDEVSQKAERLAELVLALDEWIRKGGFLPKAWGGCVVEE